MSSSGKIDEVDAFLELVGHHLRGWISSGFDKYGNQLPGDLSNLKRVTIKCIGGTPVSAVPEVDDPQDYAETFAPTTANYSGLWGDEGGDCDDEVTTNHGEKDDEPVVQVHASPERGFEFI